MICALWVISYHHFALTAFEDYQLNLLEKVCKVLDYFNKEKIVRIILLLLENLVRSEICLEIMSDINCLSVVEKLCNRHWVDKDINEMLEKQFHILDNNQQNFSSIEKFKKEVQKKMLRWGPVHTEKFWQENHIHFNEKDNLDLINDLVRLLEEGSDDKVKAIACFDLGEFARFFSMGRAYLERS